jgi:protein TonB
VTSEILQAGLPPANDRMLTTCFLAALFHGIVILGVTFSSPQSKAGGPEAPALEIVLVNGDAPSAAKNPSARYIAQRTQLGAGMLTQRTSIPRSSLISADRAGVLGGTGNAAQQATQDFGDDELIATHAPTLKVLYFAAGAAAKEPSQVQEPLEKRPNLGMTPTDDGIELRMRGESKHQLWIAADTRESDVAVYLDSWRRKIERVGTMNFPDVARRKNLSGTPVIEVTIGANGRLLETKVRRSSGHAEIDEAAMRILKLASPYDPFPSDLNAKHDQIRIAYEWQFLGGSAQGSSVFYADPGVHGDNP